MTSEASTAASSMSSKLSRYGANTIHVRYSPPATDLRIVWAGGASRQLGMPNYGNLAESILDAADVVYRLGLEDHIGDGFLNRQIDGAQIDVATAARERATPQCQQNNGSSLGTCGTGTEGGAGHRGQEIIGRSREKEDATSGLPDQLSAQPVSPWTSGAKGCDVDTHGG